jgi:tetratricopeptide (TPR) repeat protein
LIWLAKLLSETDRPEEALKNTKDAVAILEKLVEDYPDLPEYYGQLGEAYIELGKLLGESRQLEQAEDTYKKAVAISTKAIELEPDNAEFLNNFAWTLATSSAVEIRDSAQAIESANRACEITEWQNPMYIDTLAAAYAEAGDFDAAVKWQKKAIELLSDEIRDDVRSDCESRLRLYENDEPYHQE